MMTPRILIVDDHEIVRMGIKSHLLKSRPDWEVCGETTNGEEAIRLTRELKPDVVILDITMPQMSGLEACSRMRKLGLSTPVLMFTNHDFERMGIEVRDAGAQGYVLKSQAVRDLIQAIDTLLAGGTFFGAPPKPEPTHGNKPDPGISFFSKLDFRYLIHSLRPSFNLALLMLKTSFRVESRNQLR
jgi:DNA-binding NarL/FixJ family response regulator